LVTLDPIATQQDDRQLVDAARSGDRAALDQLLRRHYPRIHAVCRRVVGSGRDADDACQEAMIKIVRSLPRFDGRSTFATWAYRVATNAALDELRRRRRRPMLHVVDDEQSTEPADTLAERRVTAVEDRLALDAALDELSEEFRVAVVLRDVADLDYDEIAAVLDIPVGTVKSRIARGRRALAERLRVDDLPPVPEDGPPPAPDRSPIDGPPADGSPTDGTSSDQVAGNRDARPRRQTPGNGSDRPTAAPGSDARSSPPPQREGPP
jgi:RNA polymerase sigma-70 factor (ECF subfamily)